MVRKIGIYKTDFVEFYKEQDKKVQEKIEQILDLIRYEKRVPIKFFKFLAGTDGIYEIKVITVFKSIRILCFFDDGLLVVLTNAFLKKAEKTPKAEIAKAEKLKVEYFKDKLVEKKYGKHYRF